MLLSFLYCPLSLARSLAALFSTIMRAALAVPSRRFSAVDFLEDFRCVSRCSLVELSSLSVKVRRILDVRHRYLLSFPRVYAAVKYVYDSSFLIAL